MNGRRDLLPNNRLLPNRVQMVDFPSLETSTAIVSSSPLNPLLRGFNLRLCFRLNLKIGQMQVCKFN